MIDTWPTFSTYTCISDDIYLKKAGARYNTTDQLQTGKAVIRWNGNKCAHLSSHQILIFPNILIPPCSFHTRTLLFHHAWLMTAILVHLMLQWRSYRVKKRPKPACDIQFLIRKKSRLWAHLEQLSTSLVCDNRDILTVQKILNNMYISGFVNTICGTKLCEMPKNKRTITAKISWWGTSSKTAQSVFFTRYQSNKGIMSMCNILVVLSWITPLSHLMVSDGNKFVAQPMSVIWYQYCKEIIT